MAKAHDAGAGRGLVAELTQGAGDAEVHLVSWVNGHACVAKVTSSGQAQNFFLSVSWRWRKMHGVFV